MQILNAEVTPVELKLRTPVRMVGSPVIKSIQVLFVRLDTVDGKHAWGSAVADPFFTGETPEHALEYCRKGADMVVDLHPTNLEYSLGELTPVTSKSPAAACAFDMLFHDLLGLAANLPVYKLLGGYRDRIQTSATVLLSDVEETVEVACKRAKTGFRHLKIKGGINPKSDVDRIKAVQRALPDHQIRLDADGGYDVQSSLDVIRALETRLEMLEQPTPPDDLESLRFVTQSSKLPIIADQSISGIGSALKIATEKIADGLSLKMATCGGFRCADLINAICKAAGISTMVGCIIEPAHLISAGLHFALSSPNIVYCDLDGHLDLIDDPTIPGFKIENGWLIVSDVPGLGCTVSI